MPNGKPRPSTDAVTILHRRYYAGKPNRVAALERVRVNAGVGRQIYALRRKTGLTQQELARRVSTTASVISRLEDDDYEGHSLSMLRRIAAALDQEITIRFVPRKKRRRAV